MNTRQEKVSKQILKDMAEIIGYFSKDIAPGKILTVSEVRITPDLGLARILISIFPSDKNEAIVKELNNKRSLYRNELSKKLRHQLKKMPEIEFFLDDSLNYIEKIDNLLKK
jgi:ribosome-binding factor A